jgi:putative ABC transport system permease protein
MLTLFAVLFCAAALTSLYGITTSSAIQTALRFTAMETSNIEVSLPPETWQISEERLLSPLSAIESVQSAGTLAMPQDGSAKVTVVGNSAGSAIETNVAVGTMKGLKARGASLISGRPLPSDSIASRDTRCVLIGSSLAKELGIGSGQQRARISIDGVELAVNGIIDDSKDEAILATTVFITPQTASFLRMLPVNRSVLVSVTEGRAEAAVPYLAAALFPSNPKAVSVKAPADPKSLRASLIADSRDMTTIVTAVMVAVTAFSIINTMQLAVTERRQEIGISLAIGMPRSSVAAQLFIEAAALGLIGSVMGMLAGAVIAAAGSYLNGWTFALPAQILYVPVLGLGTGAIAGLIPASNASRIDPAELLRAE